MLTRCLGQETAGVATSQRQTVQASDNTLRTQRIRRAPFHRPYGPEEQALEPAGQTLPLEPAQRTVRIRRRCIHQEPAHPGWAIADIQTLTKRRGGISAFERQLTNERMCEHMKEHEPGCQSHRKRRIAVSLAPISLYGRTKDCDSALNVW